MTKPVFTEQTPLPARPEPDFRRWIIIHRMPFWIYVRIRRPYKEMAKEVLFSLLPGLFSRRIEFQHWKIARRFAGKQDSFRSLSFWKKAWRNGEILVQQATPTKSTASNEVPALAVAIHAFYPEILSEILQYMGSAHLPQIHLFVTCPPTAEYEVNQILSQQHRAFTLHVVENKGRDVLPFLKILPEIQNQGYTFLLKIHTKKSSHLINNAGWKKDIFEKLLSPEKIIIYTNLLSLDNRIGLIAPEGHILPMAMYYSNNAGKVLDLCLKMGLDHLDYPKIHFVAGTMFYAKIATFQPLIDLGLGEDDFEAEEGQVDGTMAHAVERAIGAACLKQKLWMIDTKSSTQYIHSKLIMHYNFSI